MSTKSHHSAHAVDRHLTCIFQVHFLSMMISIFQRPIHLIRPWAQRFEVEARVVTTAFTKLYCSAYKAHTWHPKWLQRKIITRLKPVLFKHKTERQVTTQLCEEKTKPNMAKQQSIECLILPNLSIWIITITIIITTPLQPSRTNLRYFWRLNSSP